MADQFYGYDEDESQPKGRDNLFLWTVFILLLIGAAFACWLGSFWIFGHPEQPRAYSILTKLGKIVPPRRFEDTAAPQGDFLTAQKLFERYSKFSRLELERENAELLRNYINNYRDTKKLVPYLRGKFDILDSYELKSSDLFTSGVVALAQSVDFPQVVIEHVFTAPPENVPAIKRALRTGFPLTIERTKDLSAVVHVEKVYEGRLQLTAVPLLYGSYALKGGVGTFSLEPPASLNVGAEMPIVKKQMLQDGMKRLAQVRRQSPAPEPGEPGETKARNPELVRLDAIPEGVKPPPTGALPEMPVATPVPIAAARTPRPAATPPLVAMNVTPRPAPTPIPAAPELPPMDRPIATPLPRVSPGGVPLTPFIASNPAARSVPGTTWRTYPAGQAPAARVISPAEASELADRGDLGERLYLRGQFVVTATVENRSVLRPQGSPAGPGAGSTRVIVEYPGGAVPPTEGTNVARDATRPLEVKDVRRGEDGQINIFAREITQPQ